MNDRDLMQDMLLLEKGACDLYVHGAIESSTQHINQTFKTALDDSLSMQNELYKKMEAKGWYQTDEAQQTKINSLKQKFSSASTQG